MILVHIVLKLCESQGEQLEKFRRIGNETLGIVVERRTAFGLAEGAGYRFKSRVIRQTNLTSSTSMKKMKFVPIFETK
jgi:hypothetical protein